VSGSLTFTAASDKVLIKSTKARVYSVVALCESVELADQTLVNDVPQMNALHHITSRHCIELTTTFTSTQPAQSTDITTVTTQQNILANLINLGHVTRF